MVNNANNETVLLTGASSGMGYEMAKILAEKGFNLILVSRTENKLNELKKDILSNNKINVSIDIIPMDLSKQDSAYKLYEECKKNNYKIDRLINNAGFAVFTDNELARPQEVIDMLNLNVITLTTLCNLFGKEMKERKNGHILNIASAGAYMPLPMTMCYGASKTYVLKYSRGLRCELKKHNVGVTCVSPGMTKTNFFKTSNMKISKSYNGLMMTSRQVAEIAVKAMLKNKVSVITGFKNKMLVFFSKFVPESFLYKQVRKSYDNSLIKGK